MHAWHRHPNLLLLSCLTLSLLTACGARDDRAAATRPAYIAHAGGEVDGQRYTNSRNALDSNYARGFRYFEMDFEWTSDDQLVLVHDWERTWPRLSGSTLAIPTIAQFMATPFRRDLQQLDLQALLDWLDRHPDVRIITDVKSGNLRALAKFATQRHRDRFIPQVYSPDEYTAAREMGFERVILTVYRLAATPETVIRFVEEQRPWALVVPLYKVERGDYAKLLENRTTPLYVHTVNDPERWRELQNQGVTGIYTDTLIAMPATGQLNEQ